MSPLMQKVLKLLADSKVEEAVAVFAELQHQISELEEDRDVIEDLIERVRPKKGPFKLNIKNRKPKSKVLTQIERSALVKDTARALAKANSGKTKIADVRKAIEAEGIDLGTSVPGTLIANVLIKSDDWVRLDDGGFQYVGSQ